MPAKFEIVCGRVAQKIMLEIRNFKQKTTARGACKEIQAANGIGAS